MQDTHIELNEEKHIYTVDGREVPSVTQILDILTYQEFGKIDKATLDYASKRGSDVHEVTELCDLGMYAEAEFDYEIEPYIRAYLDFKRDYRPSWDRIEEMVTCIDDNYDYAGTIDRAGRMGDRYIILDIKTVGSPNRMTYIKVCLQTFLYSLCIPEDADLWALFLTKHGTYTLINCKEWWKKHINHPLNTTAYEILEAYKLISNIKRKDF